MLNHGFYKEFANPDDVAENRIVFKQANAFLMGIPNTSKTISFLKLSNQHRTM